MLDYVAENDIERHAKESLLQMLEMSGRKELHQIRTISDAVQFVNRNQSLLAQAAVAAESQQGEIRKRHLLRNQDRRANKSQQECGKTFTKCTERTRPQGKQITARAYRKTCTRCAEPSGPQGK